MVRVSVLICALAMSVAGGQQPDGRGFTIRVEPASAAQSCVLETYQTGDFGGSRGNVGIKTIGGGAFVIPAGIGDRPAKTLKVAVWCRGSRIALLNVPALDISSFEQTVTLTPLEELPLSGRLRPSPDGVNLSGAILHVWYLAPWLCGFFEIIDCGVPQWTIAAGRVNDDGTFGVMVPDFASDPTVAKSTWGLGHFVLRADRNTAPYNYWLEPEGARSFGSVPVAASYGQLLLQPRRN